MKNRQYKLLEALPFIVLCVVALTHLPPASAADQKGMVVTRDPQTGQLRAPTPSEMQELNAQARTLAAPVQSVPAQPTLVARPDVTRQVRLGDAGQVYSIVTRDSDGKLLNQCVQGERAANAVLTQGITISKEEQRHEDR
ncbi:post-PEP-CTERM-1 domain-containing protein [Massilia horti]|uniref:Uncharacterized protein n=1 Tax=Massilia horti TaxID=2562153 RepID=A0A4Y9SRB3_9BURK|nr:hypothetical protein [Massilia horti]TFW28017.1 hypothetical protein E4O92_22395 [Massilia horti]